MPKTFSDAYNRSLYGPVHENWIVKLFWDSDPDANPNNCIKIAFATTTVDDQEYMGAIENDPEIRESISLKEAKAKTDNVTVDVANFKYNGDLVSEMFLREYPNESLINKTVLIYSQLDGESTLSNCPIIFEGILLSADHDHETIKLLIVSRMPWHGRMIPNEVNDNLKYVPLAFGDFSPNLSTFISKAFCTENALRPLSVDIVKGTNVYCPENSEATGSGALHLYEKGLKQFIPVRPTAGTLYDHAGGKALIAYTKMWRDFLYKPTDVQDAGNYSNADKTIDGAGDETSTYAEYNDTIQGEGDAFEEIIELNLPSIIGKFTSFKVKLTYDLTMTLQQGAVDLNITVGGNVILNKTTSHSSGKVTTTSAEMETSINHDDFDGVLEVGIDGVIGVMGDPDGICDVILKIYDVVIEAEARVGKDDPEALTDFLDDLEILYTGGDGFIKSYEAGGGAVSAPHEVHREMLKKILGWTATDANLQGWSSLKTDRATWELRLWFIHPDQESLKDVLEKVQFEGGFIFKFSPIAGSANKGGKYIHILDSYADGDIDHTLSINDIENIKFRHIKPTSIISGRDINYIKHPAESGYIAQIQSRNATSRSAWNIATDENIKPVNLDYYVAPTPLVNPLAGAINNNFSSYYDQIDGDIMLKAKTSVINPLFYKIETGDICRFNDDLDVKGYGLRHNTKAFMITTILRKVGLLDIELDEVSRRSYQATTTAPPSSTTAFPTLSPTGTTTVAPVTTGTPPPSTTLTPNVITILSPLAGLEKNTGDNLLIRWTADGAEIYYSKFTIELWKNGTFLRELVEGQEFTPVGQVGGIDEFNYNWSIPWDLITGADYVIRVLAYASTGHGDSGAFTITNTSPTSTTTVAPTTTEAPWIQNVRTSGSTVYKGQTGIMAYWDWYGGTELVIVEIINSESETVYQSEIIQGTIERLYFDENDTANWPIDTLKVRVRMPDGSYSDDSILFHVLAPQVTTTSTTTEAPTTTYIPPTPVVSNVTRTRSELIGGVQDQFIEWNITGTAQVRVYIYRKVTGSNVEVARSDVISGSIGAYMFTAIDTGSWPTDNDYFARVSIYKGGVNDYADSAYFAVTLSATTSTTVTPPTTTVAGKSIQVTEPNGGEIVYESGLFDIEFNYTGAITNVRIELWQSSAYLKTLVASTSASTKRWTWPISIGDNGTEYKIKVIDTSDASVYDFSDSEFTIETA